MSRGGNEGIERIGGDRRGEGEGTIALLDRSKSCFVYSDAVLYTYQGGLKEGFCKLEPLVSNRDHLIIR